jgi:hypothetical protein
VTPIKPFFELLTKLETERGHWDPLVQIAMNIMLATSPPTVKYSYANPISISDMDKFAKFEVSVE